MVNQSIETLFWSVALIYVWILTTCVQTDPINPLTMFRLKTNDGRYLSAFRYGGDRVLLHLTQSQSSYNSDQFVYDPCLFQLRSLSEQSPVDFNLNEEKYGKQVMAEIDCSKEKKCIIWVHYKPIDSASTITYVVNYDKESALVSLVKEGTLGGCTEFEFFLEELGKGAKKFPTLHAKYRQIPHNQFHVCFSPDTPKSYKVWKYYFGLWKFDTSTIEICIGTPRYWSGRKLNMFHNGLATDVRLYFIPKNRATDEFRNELQLRALTTINKDPVGNEGRYSKVLLISNLGPKTIFQIATMDHPKFVAFFTQQHFYGEGFQFIPNVKFALPMINHVKETGKFLVSDSHTLSPVMLKLHLDRRNRMAQTYRHAILNRGVVPGRQTVGISPFVNGVDVYLIGDSLCNEFRSWPEMQNAKIVNGFEVAPSEPGQPIPISERKMAFTKNYYFNTYAAAELLYLAPAAQLIPVRFPLLDYDSGDVFKVIESITLYAEKSQRASVVSLPLITFSHVDDKDFVQFLDSLKEVIQNYPSLAFVVSMKHEHVLKFGRKLDHVAMLVTVSEQLSDHDRDALKKFKYHLFVKPTTLDNEIILDQNKTLSRDHLEAIDVYHPTMAAAKVAGIIATNWGIHPFFNADTEATKIFDFTLATSYEEENGELTPHRLSNTCDSKKPPFQFHWNDTYHVYICTSGTSNPPIASAAKSHATPHAVHHVDKADEEPEEIPSEEKNGFLQGIWGLINDGKDRRKIEL